MSRDQHSRPFTQHSGAPNGNAPEYEARQIEQEGKGCYDPKGPLEDVVEYVDALRVTLQERLAEGWDGEGKDSQADQLEGASEDAQYHRTQSHRPHTRVS
jgi:hypothetical protein